MTQVTRRRRGPNRPKPVEQAAIGEVAEAKSLSKRRRRASVGGHALKLNAPLKAGYERRWFNDTGNRLADAEDLGYTFVEDPGIKTDMPGSHITRRVGIAASGGSQQAYLMETPDELYAEGVDEREELNSQVDQAIVKGADFTGQMTREDGSYGQGSIRVER